MASLGGGLFGAYMFNNLRSSTLFLGAGGAFVYNWLSDNFSYNRDAWMTDTALMQAHGFQKDNMDVAVHSMARDAVRDRQTCASTQLSNNILTTTLFLAMAMDVLVSGVLPDHCDDFVVNLYMIALSSGIIYLILAICAAVVAIMIMYTVSAEILTANLDELWTRLDRKMSSYGELLTAQFEHRKAKDMFTPPMAKFAMHRFKPASYIAGICGMRSTGDAALDLSLQDDANQALGQPAEDQDTGQATSADDNMPEKADRLHSIILSYRDAWLEREPLWLPVQTHSRLMAVLGVKSLLDAWGYFVLAKYFGEHSSAWALWLGQLIFVFLNVALVPVLLSVGVGARFKVSTAASIMLAPFLALTSVVTCHTWIASVCVPGCYLTHFLLNLQGIFGYGGPKRHVEELAEHALNRKVSAKSEHDLNHELNAECQPPSEGGTKRPVDTDIQQSFSFADFSQTETQRLDEVEERAKQAEMVQVYLKNILLASRSMITLLWGIAFVWSCHKVLCGSSFRNAKAPICFSKPAGLRLHAPEVLPVTWPSPFFHAHVLTSGHFSSATSHLSLLQSRGVKTTSEFSPNASTFVQTDSRLIGRVFVADRFNVLEVTGNLTARHYPCESNAPIADVAVSCNSSSCMLRALLHTKTPAILNCETGAIHSLLQAPEAPARRFTALSMETLLVTHGNDVVQYDWSAVRRAWVPSSTIVESSNSSAHASGDFEMLVAASDNLLFLVQAKSKLEVRDLTTGQTCGTWALPNGVVDMAMQNSSSILLLVRGLSDQQELRPSKLMRTQIDNIHCHKAVSTHSNILQKALEMDA